MKTTLDSTRRRLNDENIPTYCRLVASINPLMIGPRVCPTSIIVLRKPMDVPTRLAGANSLISGDVEDITIAKPSP